MKFRIGVGFDLHRLGPASRLNIGISGGLDSTLGLLVAVKTCDLLGWPRNRVAAVYRIPDEARREEILGQLREGRKTTVHLVVPHPTAFVVSAN